MQRYTPESMVKRIGSKRAFLAVRGFLGKAGIHCNAYCAFIRSMGMLSKEELEFWAQEKIPSTGEIENHLRILPVATRENYYLVFSPEDRFPGDLSQLNTGDLVMCSSSSSSGKPALVIRSRHQMLGDREPLELQLMSTLPRKETEILARILYAERDVRWAPGIAMTTLLEDLKENPGRLTVDTIDHGADWNACAQELTQLIIDWNHLYPDRPFSSTVVYAFTDRAVEMLHEIARIAQGDEKILQTVGERIHIAATGMPFDVTRRIRILQMLGSETPIQLNSFQNHRELSEQERKALKIYAEFTLDSFGAIEYNAGYSGTPLTNLILLILESTKRCSPNIYEKFCLKWFGRETAPRALVKASNPSLYIYTGNWEEHGIMTPSTEKRGPTGPGFAVSAPGGTANVYIGDEYTIINQKKFLEGVKAVLGVDIPSLMSKIKVKREGSAPLLWIAGRVNAVYFDGQQVFGEDVLRGLEGTEHYLKTDYVLQEVYHDEKSWINVYVSSLGEEIPPKLKGHIIKGMLKTNEQLQHRLRTRLGIDEDVSEDMADFLGNHAEIENYIKVIILPEKEFHGKFRKEDKRSRIKPRKIWEPDI